MYKRFFAFGCSYTNYIWPTWADIIASDLQIEYHNYGKSGFGNVAIQSEILRTDIEQEFNTTDLIIVMWSHWNREDRFINGGWKAQGNIFNNEFYDKSFVKKYWDFDNDIIKNSTAIISTNKAYRNLIKFQSSIMPLGDFELSGFQQYAQDKNNNDLFNFYLPYLPKEVYNGKECYEFDGHPSVLSYLNYVENNIYPTLNLKLSDDSRKTYKDIDQVFKDIDQSKTIKNKRDEIKHIFQEFKSTYIPLSKKI